MVREVKRTLSRTCISRLIIIEIQNCKCLDTLILSFPIDLNLWELLVAKCLSSKTALVFQNMTYTQPQNHKHFRFEWIETTMDHSHKKHILNKSVFIKRTEYQQREKKKKWTHITTLYLICFASVRIYTIHKIVLFLSTKNQFSCFIHIPFWWKYSQPLNGNRNSRTKLSQ